MIVIFGYSDLSQCGAYHSVIIFLIGFLLKGAPPVGPFFHCIFFDFFLSVDIFCLSYVCLVYVI